MRENGIKNFSPFVDDGAERSPTSASVHRCLSISTRIIIICCIRQTARDDGADKRFNFIGIQDELQQDDDAHVWCLSEAPQFNLATCAATRLLDFGTRVILHTHVLPRKRRVL